MGAGAGFAGPRNETDAFLVQLWARELYLAEVGIHQDFASLGGDSLSWTRILLAMEEAFASPIPDEVFSNLTTVMEVSDKLSELGIVLSGNAGQGGAAAAKALDGIRVGTVGSEENLAGLIEGLEACSSVERFRILADGITVYATPAEILATLAQTRSIRLGARSTSAATLSSRLRLKWHYWRWRRDLQREIEHAPGALAWSRRQLQEAAVLYSDTAVPAQEKTLVVGFTGNLGRLMQPTHRILGCLDPTRMDLLLLRDPEKQLFAAGAPGIGSDLPAVAGFVDRLSVAEGYRRTVALGTSGGCLAAVYAALTHGWRRAILVSSPNPSRHPELSGFLQGAAAEPRMKLAEVIIAHGRNQRDVDAARQLRDYLPGATMDEHRTFGSHNILNDAHLDGTLAALIRGWLVQGEEDLGPARHQNGHLTPDKTIRPRNAERV